MDFLPHWIPTFDNEEVPECELVAALEDSNRTPSFSDANERPWSSTSWAGVLAAYGSSRPALEECLVALWRLHLTEFEGKSDPTWQLQVAAWLVSLPSYLVRKLVLILLSVGALRDHRVDDSGNTDLPNC